MHVITFNFRDENFCKCRNEKIKMQEFFLEFRAMPQMQDVNKTLKYRRAMKVFLMRRQCASTHSLLMSSGQLNSLFFVIK